MSDFYVVYGPGYRPMFGKASLNGRRLSKVQDTNLGFRCVARPCRTPGTSWMRGCNHGWCVSVDRLTSVSFAVLCRDPTLGFRCVRGGRTAKR